MHATRPQQDDQAEWVELQPAFVSASRIGPMIAALRQRGIYFQFGPRRGHEIVLFVLPTDLEHVESLTVSVCGPLVGTGCNLRMILILGVIVALFASGVLLVTALGIGA